MLDTAYIEELKLLEMKEAKDKLAEYAATFGIQVKKSRAFDNIVADISEKLKELSNAPLPENNEGLTIADLIQAADENDGKSVTEGEASDEAMRAIKGELIDTPQLKIEESEVTDNDNLATEVVITKESEVREIDVIVIHDKPVQELFELPKNYSPKLLFVGRNPGYCTLPYWIFDWINNNPDWKQYPNKFPHHYGIDTLYSLIYYIKRDGSVTIRETRNSKFHTIA